MKKYITGDLLYYKICNAKYLIEVTNTSKHGYCFKGVKEDFNGVICDEFIEDIPLTPEILEKNGWKSINGKYALKIKNANYVVLEFTEDCIYAYINEKTMLFTIKYIHELQHLLFGLGLNHEMEV